MTESFSIVQQRRFWVSLRSSVLCPSMDLVALVNSSNQLVVHRTLSWDIIGTTTNATACCWRPDGRVLAISTHSTSNNKIALSLYSIEGMLRGDEPSTSVVVGEEDDGGRSSAGYLHTLSFESAGSANISALCWAHVNANSVAVDKEMWALRLEMFGDMISGDDPSTTDAEKAAINIDAELGENEEESKTLLDDLPSLQTPLSVLAVVMGSQLHLFAHGRYPILNKFQLPAISGDNQPITQVVACSKIVHWVVLRPPSSLQIVTVDALHSQRYDWQAISTLHSQITQLLSGLKQSVADLINLWKTTLKQLDWKLDNLVKLFSQYCTEVPPNTALLQYSTNSTRHPSLSNAADQFFTSTAVNDQLLQRLDRSLQGSLANIQKLLEKQLVNPSQALARAVDAYWSLQWESPRLSSMNVVTSIAAVTVPVQDVYDCMAWLRATAAARKAAGTPANSPQRTNALQRRLPDAQWQRIVRNWKRADHTKRTSSCTVGTTEQLLGLQFQEQLEGAVKTALDAFEKAFVQEHSSIPVSSKHISSVRILGSDETKTVITRPGVVMAATVGYNCVSLYRFSLPLHSASGMKLHVDASIVDVGFYSEDGKSSLDPTTSGPEGRQRLGFVSSSTATELWMIEYDSLPWKPLQFSSRIQGDWECESASQLEGISVRKLAQADDGVVRTRVLESFNAKGGCKNARLSLSGSRGIGIVYTTEQGGSAEVLDLEDHEEDEDDDESMEEN